MVGRDLRRSVGRLWKSDGQSAHPDNQYFCRLTGRCGVTDIFLELLIGGLELRLEVVDESLRTFRSLRAAARGQHQKLTSRFFSWRFTAAISVSRDSIVSTSAAKGRQSVLTQVGDLLPRSGYLEDATSLRLSLLCDLKIKPEGSRIELGR